MENTPQPMASAPPQQPMSTPPTFETPTSHSPMKWIVSIIVLLIVAAIVAFLVIDDKSGGALQINSPEKNELFESGSTISGTINGEGWYAFEGYVGTVRLYDENDMPISNLVGLRVTSSDQYTLPTSFEATLEYSTTAEKGYLEFMSEAAKDGESTQTYRLPVTLSASSENSTLKTYGTNYISFQYPSDWTVSESSKAEGAVNVTKGKYILYINPSASQASGIEGGRFSEISQGAPSADAVILDPPAPPCDNPVSTSINANWNRYDNYVSQSSPSRCAKPSSGTAWYFSFVSDSSGKYFNYYEGELKALVVTMAYNSSDVNTLPKQGSNELNEMLGEMTDIIATIQTTRNASTKTYRSVTLGMQFQYPKTYTLSENATNYFSVTLSQEPQGEDILPISMTIRSLPNQGSLTLDEYVDEIIKQGRWEKTGTTTVAGYSSYKLIIPETESGPRYIFISGSGRTDPGTIYDISSTGISSETLEQILSSIQLL